MNLQNKNILITGGAGFIGSTIVRKLLEEKGNVFVYDNFLTGDATNLKEVKDSIKIIKGDVCDKNFKDTLLENNIQYVFHLAAEPYIPECYDRPRRFFEINANGTMNVLLACKEAGVKRILHYSSSEVYGTAQYTPMDEKHPTLPLSTYAVSKLAADRICFTLSHEQKIPVIILRQFNCYGPRETHPYIIPELITQLNSTNNLKLGNKKSRRDFTWVWDAAEAAVKLIKCSKAIGEVVNSGYGKSWSVEELAHITAELLGHNSIKIIVEKERLRPLDVQNLHCDYSKLHRLTGWKPKVKMEEGLKKTIEWFNENQQRWLWEYKIAPENFIWKPKNLKR